MSKSKFTIFGGHIVECFDNTLYGFFAVMLAPIYFPATSEKVALLASYGAFSAGFLARPIGALTFGLIGDRFGRRRPLLWSMACVGFPTMVIGFIPGYESIGIFATFLLISCRLLQGFFMGGEFTGVNLYISENKISKLGTQTGILISIGVIGAILATIMGALFSMKSMPSFAWRIPFIFGGISALTVFYFRRNLLETEEFVKTQRENQVLSNPWKVIFTHYKSVLALSSIIAGLTIVPLYCATILGNQLFKEIGYSTSQSMLLNTFAMIFDAVVIIYYGRLADKIGFYPQMLLGSGLTIILAIPSFIIVSYGTISTLNVFVFITTLTAVGGIINGCTMPFIAGYFPTNCRYSGVATSVTIGHALIGGTTPLVGTYLKGALGTQIAPAFWMLGIAIFAFIGIFLTRNKNVFYEKTYTSEIEDAIAVS